MLVGYPNYLVTQHWRRDFRPIGRRRKSIWHYVAGADHHRLSSCSGWTAAPDFTRMTLLVLLWFSSFGMYVRRNGRGKLTEVASLCACTVGFAFSPATVILAA